MNTRGLVDPAAICAGKVPQVTNQQQQVAAVVSMASADNDEEDHVDPLTGDALKLMRAGSRNTQKASCHSAYDCAGHSRMLAATVEQDNAGQEAAQGLEAAGAQQQVQQEHSAAYWQCPHRCFSV